MGQFRYEGQTEFDQREMGHGASYRTAGALLSIYVYDAGVAVIPDGADSDVLQVQYESAKAEVRDPGAWERTELLYEERVALPQVQGGWAREAAFAVERGQQISTSYLALTAAAVFASRRA